MVANRVEAEKNPESANDVKWKAKLEMKNFHTDGGENGRWKPVHT